MAQNNNPPTYQAHAISRRAHTIPVDARSLPPGQKRRLSSLRMKPKKMRNPAPQLLEQGMTQSRMSAARSMRLHIDRHFSMEEQGMAK